ncbi:MAG TPA: hypothetical protein VHI13_17730 [Candidatus Kapabacteria bacterium]|nr:hypothetical protein [Candidatus Kapabacteria bacterium]
MNQIEREELVERYLAGEMSQAQEADFFLNVAVDGDLQRTLKAFQVMDRFIQGDREHTAAETGRYRQRIMGILAATPGAAIGTVAGTAAGSSSGAGAAGAAGTGAASGASTVGAAAAGGFLKTVVAVVVGGSLVGGTALVINHYQAPEPVRVVAPATESPRILPPTISAPPAAAAPAAAAPAATAPTTGAPAGTPSQVPAADGAGPEGQAAASGDVNGIAQHRPHRANVRSGSAHQATAASGHTRPTQPVKLGTTNTSTPMRVTVDDSKANGKK